MSSYAVDIEEDTKLIICRVDGFLDDATTMQMATEWRSVIARARRQFVNLRVLFDNSKGAVASATSAQIMSEATRDLWQAGDRTAVLAANSLSKLQAKRTMKPGSEVFISEKAARIWLAA